MRWSEEQLVELMHDIIDADQLGIAMWVIDHVGVDDAAWDDLALTVASMAATAFERVTRAELGDDEEIVWSPVHHDDVEQVVRDAGQLITMQMNEDAPGQLGILAAVRSRDEVEEFVGALCIIAAGAMRAEAVLPAGGRS
ncbi:hypothetical protein ACEYYH_10615 [Microbacterium trichothecenolyticum]|uniref:hypothetical protein n=1 Tax=Microbacterium trichothecenolyticum TaxID=69370 RepID=UPI0035BE7759